jgi:glutamate-1-semialdehyde 2,1-aminomutase
MLKTNIGDKFYNHSRKYLAKGLSASARWNESLKRPLYFKKGVGAYIYDIDGIKSLDMFLSHGASILGHNNKEISESIKNAIEMGTLCSYETEYQTALAKKLCKLIPCAQLCRFSCSGTEAVMHALRLAREYTGKDLILKFEGHYHGLSDYMQYSWCPVPEKRGKRNNPNPVPFSGGIPQGIESYIKIIPFNDLDILQKTIKRLKDRLATVILEPINYNQGCIIPDKEYIVSLRELTKENDILLIFDEVLSAFRTGPDCAQGYLNVTPDICIIGKSIGGGTPISAIAGKKEILEHLKPEGECTHSGTYNGHLIPVMASLATLGEIEKPYFYDHIYKLAERLYRGLSDIFAQSRLNIKVQGLGSRFGLFFDPKKDVIKEYRDRLGENKEMGLKFYQLMYEKGIYFHGLHHGFSSAHSSDDIDTVLNCTEGIVRDLEDYF